MISGKSGGYYGCTKAHRAGLCQNKKLVKGSAIEETILGLVEDSLNQKPVIQEVLRAYTNTLKEKQKAAPSRLMQIDRELESLKTEIGRLLDSIMQGTSSPSITEAIKIREERKQKLNSEKLMLESFQSVPKTPAYPVIEERISHLQQMAKSDLEKAVPAIRALFPEPLKMIPPEKERGIFAPYTLKGRISLHELLDKDFSKKLSQDEKKGAAKNRQPPNQFGETWDKNNFGFGFCESKENFRGLGFVPHNNGVTNGT